jgi:hybrid cluster-associated redox disulfide protein
MAMVATKDMIISDLLNLHEGIAGILFKAGMNCVGCPRAAGETLEQASEGHGLDADAIIVEINAVLTSGE